MNEGKYIEALKPARTAFYLNPHYWSAYYNLGTTFLKLKELDSAQFYLEIAYGLNPYYAETLAQLGGVHYYKNNYKLAENFFNSSYELDSTVSNAIIGLVWINDYLKEYDVSVSYLTKLYDLKHGDDLIFKQAGDLYLQQMRYDIAAICYNFALNRGMDSSYIDKIKTKYPQFKMK
jgi:tetratricopeptide (TPR) repeat protein